MFPTGHIRKLHGRRWVGRLAVGRTAGGGSDGWRRPGRLAAVKMTQGLPGRRA